MTNGHGRRNGEPQKRSIAESAAPPAVMNDAIQKYKGTFPFATHFLQCPIPVCEPIPRTEWLVRIDGTFAGRRAKVLQTIKAASIACRGPEKSALDLLLDIFADAMGY